MAVVDVEGVFEAARPELERIARGVARDHGGTFDEHFAVVCYGFVTACRRFDPAKNDDPVGWGIWNARRAVWDAVRTANRDTYRCCPFSSLAPDVEPAHPVASRGRVPDLYDGETDDADGVERLAPTIDPDPLPFDRTGFEHSLPDDARVVIGLVFESPAELASAVGAGWNDWQVVRGRIIDYARRHWGWSKHRSRAAFQAVVGALT